MTKSNDHYAILTYQEARDLGFPPPDFEGTWEEIFSNKWDPPEYCLGIWYVNAFTSKFIGNDGGEPEDQTLGRDWSWVVDALNEAYETGWSAAKWEDGKDA